jgi:hypothetical protein
MASGPGHRTQAFACSDQHGSQPTAIFVQNPPMPTQSREHGTGMVPGDLMSPSVTKGSGPGGRRSLDPWTFA